VEGPVSIGRDEQCTLAIADLALSRWHCEVSITEGGIVLRDLGSRNGCFVSGRPIAHHVLADG
jgi:pSer/pThr/pTyr-binding forkhead associated (FHA) protein